MEKEGEREREREAQAEAQHSLHGLNPLEMVKILNEENNYRELFEQARKCAEVAR